MRKHRKYDGINELNLGIYFTEMTPLPSKNQLYSLTSNTADGVYELAGENVKGIYDLSSTTTVCQEPKEEDTKNLNERLNNWNDRYNRNAIKEWMLIHRNMIVFLVILTICIILGLGISLSKFSKSQNMNTTIHKSPNTSAARNKSFAFTFILYIS